MKRLSLALMATGLAVSICATTARAQEKAIRIADWYALGPMGSAALKSYPADAPGAPRHEKEFRGMLYWYKVFLHHLKDYPMSPEGGGIIDLDATYEGDITINAAGETLEVSWERIQIPNRNTRYPLPPRMHNGCGMTFFSSWIYSETDTSGRVFFNGYGGEDKKGNGISCWVNGRYLPTKWMRKDIPMIQQPTPGATVNLKAGWNHVYVRHISAWRGTYNSMMINVPAAAASGIKVSAEPPESLGRSFKFNGTPVTDDTSTAKAQELLRTAPPPKPQKPAPKKTESGVKQFDLF